LPSRHATAQRFGGIAALIWGGGQPTNTKSACASRFAIFRIGFSYRLDHGQPRLEMCRFSFSSELAITTNQGLRERWADEF